MNSLQYVQKGKFRGQMKERNHKLTLTFANVPNVETAGYVLEEIITDSAVKS